MADKLTDEIKLLFRTSIQDKDIKEVSKNIKSALENAVITFDEAEIKKEIVPVIQMLQKLFAKAEMKFDAEKLFAMPSREALQKIANISVDKFQAAFDRALEKSGGVKIDFGDFDFSSLTTSLGRVEKDLERVANKIADTTKKSVSDIEESIRRLNKTETKTINSKKPVDGSTETVKTKETVQTNRLDTTVGSIEKLFSDIDSGNKTNATQIRNAYKKYIKTIENNDPWEIQYQAIVEYVAKFESLSAKTKGKLKELPDFQKLYDSLSPKAGAARESLHNLVSTARGGELSEYKNQPWGRESTLKEIRDTLKGGISVKEGSGGDNARKDDTVPPWEDKNEDVKPKNPNTKVPTIDNVDVNAAEQAKKTEEERLRIAEQRRIEQEKIAEMLKKESEFAQTPKTKTEEMLLEVVKEAKSKSSVSWDKTDSADQQRFIQEAIWSRFTPTSSADEDVQFDLEYDVFGYSNGKKGKDLSTVAARFEKWTTSLEVEYDKASDEVKQIVQKLAMIDDELSQEAWDVSEKLYEKNETLAQLIEDDHNGSWTNLRNNLRGNSTPEVSANNAKQTNGSLVEQTTLLEKIQKLTTYIDDNYLSAGKHLSDFLNDVQMKSNELDSELKEILSTLNLIDDKGNLKFDIKRNGEQGGGTTHNGALISDEFVLIERGDYEGVKNSNLPDSTQNATKDGINVAEVLGYLPSKHNGGFFDVQGTAKGHNLFENGVISQDVVNATEDQLEQLVQAFIKARDYGFDIENGGSNIIYDKEKGFSFYDLEELSTDEAEFWNSKTEAEKKLIAIENVFSLFSGINRDHSNFDNDDNVGVLAERIKGVVENKGIIDPGMVDDIGRNYEDIYDDVFSGNIDEDYNDVVAALHAQADAHKQNTAAIKEEEHAQEEANQSFLDGVLASARARAGLKDTEVDSSAEVAAEKTETDAINQQNEALKENIDLKAKANAQGDNVVVDADAESDAITPSSGSTEVKASIDTEELRGLLNAITYNVKVIQDVEPAESNKVSIDAAELKSVLDSIIYNVKLTHSDTDKESNKIAIDESVLESTLKRVFTNVLNPNTEQNDSEPKNEPWALEKTLSTTIKGVLDKIQTNTAKVDVSSDTTGTSEFTTKLVEIKSILESINAKIMKGGVIATRDAVKQAGAQAVEPDVKRQAARSNMMKSIINDYKTMGKLAAQFASDGNLETKAMLENLKEEIRRKRASLNITMDENAHLREKYSIAFEAEKRLLEAEEQQRKINEQNKSDAKAEKKRLADAKKLAQREAMVGKAGNAVGRAENTWMNAVGLEDELPADFVADIDTYYQKLDAVRKMHQELKNSDMISEEQKKELVDQTMEINKMTEEIGELIAEYQRLSGNNTTVIGSNTLGTGAGLGEYERQLKQAVMTATNGKAQIKKFDAATKTLTYTVKTGKNEFTEYTAAVRRVGGALVSVRGDTKRTETFLEATKRKMKEISSYMSGMALISRVGQELRRGIQYVREIDLALTELKKVTDETEESYDKFLETAAKTGARLGSTISAVTEATATFAKLGYEIKQATEMAEAAIVYKNVGDNIESTEDAANSIISTMKGFRLEASESMEIVDRFNEVGKSIAHVI